MTIPQTTFDRIADWIQASDLPWKAHKLDGLRRCFHKRLNLDLVDWDGIDVLLLDGVAIDPSELENGHWL
jgi:hypothetical protein